MGRLTSAAGSGGSFSSLLGWVFDFILNILVLIITNLIILSIFNTFITSMDQSSSVRKLCRFVLATSYNKQIPQICRWLIDKDEDGDFRFQVTMLSDNKTQQDISDHFANDDLDLGFHDPPVNTSAPNITLILILSLSLSSSSSVLSSHAQ